MFGAAQDSEYKFELCRKASFSKMVAQRAPRSPAMNLEGDDAALISKKEKMWKLMELYLPATAEAIQRGIVNHVVSFSFWLRSIVRLRSTLWLGLASTLTRKIATVPPHTRFGTD